MKREVGEGGGLRESVFLGVAAILNAWAHAPAPPPPPTVVPSELRLGQAEVWIIGNQHPALNTGYVRPRGPSSAWRISFQDITPRGIIRRLGSCC